MTVQELGGEFTVQVKTRQHGHSLHDLVRPSGSARLPSAQAPDAGPTSRDGGPFAALKGAGFILVLFFLALLMPTYTSFSIGSLRLTVYRFFLLASIVPCTIQLLSRGKSGLLAADALIAASVFWAATTIIYHENIEQGLESGGIFILESLGSYLLARVLIYDERTFRSFVALLTLIVGALLLLTLPEALTGKNLFGQPITNMDKRLGLERARGCFDHPIVHGVFCSSILAMSWHTFAPRNMKWNMRQPFYAALISMGALTSVSSGAITALLAQFFLISWVRLTRQIRHPWRLLLGIFAMMYVAIDLLSNRTPLTVMLSYLTLSPDTAYARLRIWEWGFYENVLKHPLVGIGEAEWVRPEWMVSGSIDSFWLVLMVQNGIPCFLFLAWAIVALIRSTSNGAKSQGVTQLYTGWCFSLIGLIVAASTVHLWNAAFVYFFFLLGAGGWFCKGNAHPLSSR